MLSFDIKQRRFNYRVAGIVLHEDWVWLHADARDAFWALPGGRCEWHEASDLTLKRELLEEIGVDVTVGPLLWVAEDFYHYKGMHYHEIGLYYAMKLEADSPFLNKATTLKGLEADCELTYKWHRLEDLTELPVRPGFLADELHLYREYIRKTLPLPHGRGSLNSSANGHTYPRHIRHHVHEDRPMRSAQDVPLS